MVSQMNQRARRVRLKSAEADLQRRQLAARIVRILDDRDARVARNRGAHALAMRSENNHQPRHDREHRFGDVLDEGLSADLEERFRIAHPSRLALPPV